MYRVKQISGFIAVAAFLVAVAVGGADAGALEDKKLLVDTVVNVAYDAGTNTVAPSMAMAGDTVKVELFVNGGGGNKALALDAKFGAAIGDIMIPDEAWGIVAASTIFPLQLKVGPHAVQVGALPHMGPDIPASGYLGTVKIVGAADAPEGASFYVKHAYIADELGSVDTLDVSEAVVTIIGLQTQLRLDTRIESPPRNDDVLTLPEKRPGETIQFQLFAPDAGGRQVQGYTVELALKDKTFGSYIDDVAGADFNGSALLSRVSDSGNPTLSMLSLSALTVPASGYLGLIDLNVSRALTSSDVLAVPSASTAGPGGVQNLDVSQAMLTFTAAAACPGDFDGNGMVNLSDFLAFAGAFGTRSGTTNYDARVDMDGNGAIDLSDFLAFAGVFGTTCPTSPPTPPPPPPPPANPDRQALVALYNATNGANWTKKTNWLSERPLGEWHGVTTDLSGRVTGLELYDNVLSGSLPSELGDLASLTELWLSGNQVSGVLPASLGNRTNLRVLDLDDNALSGSLPTWLGGLTNLEILTLGNNQFSGVLPSWLGNLTNLTELALGHSAFSGSLPSWLGNLTNLRYLGLHGNQLSGALPPSLGNLKNLEYLGLFSNPLSGALPSSLVNLTNLEYLFLQSTQLCAPTDAAFQAWLQGIANKHGVTDCTIGYGDGNPIAGTIRRLTRNSARDRFPSWSPDGRQIAFASERDGNYEIYVMGSDGNNPRRLTHNSAGDHIPSWSPDGRQIAFASERDGDLEIYVMGSDGSNPRRLTHNSARDYVPSWSPDGRHIAFDSGRDGNYEIYVMGSDGSNPRRLTHNSAGDYHPSWSPDGRHIAFLSDRDGNYEIYVMGSDGSYPRRLTHNSDHNVTPSWSPDGQQIAFASGRDGNYEIYVMGSDGSYPRRLTHNSARDYSPSWSPDGRHIAFHSGRDGNLDIYVMDLQSDAGGDSGTTKIYWTDSGWSKIQRSNLDGTGVEDLVATNVESIAPLGLALDVAARKMYWASSGVNGGPGKIQRANLDGSGAEDLVTTGLDYPVGLALDGSAGKMYWTDYNARRIRRANLDGSGMEDLVTTGNPAGLFLDLNAGKMYWAAGTSGGVIQRANLDGTGVQDIVSRLGDPYGLALDLNAGKIYWTIKGFFRGSDKIQRANLDGSGVEDLVTTGFGAPSDLALDAGKLYWTEYGTNVRTGKIRRANVDGSGIQDLVTGLHHPVGLALNTRN